VHDKPNEWTSAAELRRDLTLDALLHGAGHAQVICLTDGTPSELHRLDPGRVQRHQETDGEPFFRVNTDAGTMRLSYRDVLRVGSIGSVSPITLGREAITLALSFESHIGGLFANGGRPSGVVKANNTSARSAPMASCPSTRAAVSVPIWCVQTNMATA